MKVATLGTYADKFGQWLQLSDDSMDHLKEGLKNVQLQKDLMEASWQELVLHLVPSWNEFGTKLKCLDWANNEVSSKEEVQEVTGWDQNGTKVLQKKTAYLIQILTLTSKSISLEDMMNAIGYKNRASFRRNYLDALENVEFVSKTIPDTPSSPDQKYMLTEKGKLFLAGYNFDTK